MISITVNQTERNAIQKKRQKHKKQEPSHSLSRDSDSSDNSDYIRKQRKN